MRAEASEEASYICPISRIAKLDDNAQCIPKTARTVTRDWYERVMQPLLASEDNPTIDMARPILLERMGLKQLSEELETLAKTKLKGFHLLLCISLTSV